MRYNQNDYVVVNGKKYYAMGGDTQRNPSVESPDIIIDKDKLKEYIENITRYKNIYEETPKYFTDFGDEGVTYTPSGHAKSNLHGNALFNKYTPEIQDKIRAGRVAWANELEERRKYGEADDLERYGITKDVVDKFKKSTNFDDDASQRVNYYMSKKYPNVIYGDSQAKNGKIYSGDNVFWALAASITGDRRARYIPKHWDELSKLGVSREYMTDPNKRWTVHEIRGDDDPNKGAFIYSFYDNYKNPKPIVAIRNGDGTWGGYVNTYDPTLLNNKQTSEVYDLDGKRKLRQSTRDYMDKRNVSKQNIIPSNMEGLKFAQTVEGWANGGRTSRLYATGGSMGDIPLGEQEDYNMVGEGGSHEENPMGGVPYGINQDGSQNMVEEGEVTVGDNVFSNRVSLSPELCQQLNLPQGTTPAQAMTQIEQLYEQGQLQDEEYQEISDIIFQDQEAQKQGGEQQPEGMPPEGMEGQPPAEGLDPSQLQGGAMPPEMMQGGMPPQDAPMPQDMAMQQGGMPPQEGITPDMVQGGSYAYGGYMRRRF